MALVLFLRGVNVGGHRRLRPKLLAKRLAAYDVVNVGATGTFVVRKPPPRATLLEALRKALPFAADVVICNGRDVSRLAEENPFGKAPYCPNVVRFVSILTKAARFSPRMPATIPNQDDWFVRLVAVNQRFVFGEYRRHMRTIGYLGQIDKLFGVPATTRSWKTIQAVIRIARD
jgi:uncharacterized protein (DUF1697 family)